MSYIDFIHVISSRKLIYASTLSRLNFAIYFNILLIFSATFNSLGFVTHRHYFFHFALAGFPNYRSKQCIVGEIANLGGRKREDKIARIRNLLHEEFLRGSFALTTHQSMSSESN